MKVISDAHTCKDRRTYVQGRLQVRAEKVASISVEEAVHCIFSRKRLQPFPQTFATFASNVCNLSLKRLQSFPQTFAIFASNVCGEKSPFVESLPLMSFC